MEELLTIRILANKYVIRRRNDIYCAKKRRGIAMAAYLMKFEVHNIED